jgi:alpha-L-fucosidase
MRRFTRRETIAMLAAAAPAWKLAVGQTPVAVQWPIRNGPFAGTHESLAGYETPRWYGEAKFGIWSHWGPQSGVEDGDWYARNMYVQGSPEYDYHVKTYGPQSKVGYKDLIPQFKAARWEPDQLLDLYAKAGAKYFFSMGVHHDNFDMWHSKYQPRWNAVATGPKRDIVGEYAKAARKRGLRFGVSEHLSNSFAWFAPAHTADKTGPLAGVPYDGSDPAYADLYHDYTGEPANFTAVARDMQRVDNPKWKTHYFQRINDLVDQHEPDLLYADGGIQYGELGLSLVANFYNVSAARNGGKVEAVYFSKTASDCEQGTCTLDRERGVLDGIAPHPWQTDTCIGQWHYKRGQRYKSAKNVVDLLVDIVSKNGNLLLNFPLPNSGELDAEELKVLADLTAWMQVNSEGIYATKPWLIYGEGPSTKVAASKGMFDFNESKRPALGPEDIRFTTKGGTLYAFVQGWPTGGEAKVVSLGRQAELAGKGAPRITSAQMLGRSGNLRFRQQPEGLFVTLPGPAPATAGIGIALKLTTA